MHSWIPFVLLVAAVGAAEPEPWPKRASVKVEFTTISPNKLPRGIGIDVITMDLGEPPSVGICWFDFNRDGKDEALIDSHVGGTGGTYMHIFARTPSGFRRIGTWLGGVTVVAPANGYYQVESWSSGGGGQYSRILLRYERGRYRMVRLEDWRGNDTEEGFEFVRRRDPKEHDD